LRESDIIGVYIDDPLRGVKPRQEVTAAGGAAATNERLIGRDISSV